jgi:hypothetical protein
MKIGTEDTLSDGQHKDTLSLAVVNFQDSHAALHRRYVGRPFDDAYRREIERLYAALDAAIRTAPPVSSMEQAASLLALEVMLFKEFEGDSPEGIHGTRLVGLEAVEKFIQVAW